MVILHLSLNLSVNSLNEEGDGELFSTWDEVAESFDAMGLHENLLRGIYAYGELLEPVVKPLSSSSVDCTSGVACSTSNFSGSCNLLGWWFVL